MVRIGTYFHCPSNFYAVRHSLDESTREFQHFCISCIAAFLVFDPSTPFLQLKKKTNSQKITLTQTVFFHEKILLPKN